MLCDPPDVADGDGSYGFKGRAIVDDVRIGDVALSGFRYLINVTSSIGGYTSPGDGILGLGPDAASARIIKRCALGSSISLTLQTGWLVPQPDADDPLRRLRSGPDPEGCGRLLQSADGRSPIFASRPDDLGRL